MKLQNVYFVLIDREGNIHAQKPLKPSSLPSPDQSVETNKLSLKSKCKLYNN